MRVETRTLYPALVIFEKPKDRYKAWIREEKNPENLPVPGFYRLLFLQP